MSIWELRTETKISRSTCSCKTIAEHYFHHSCSYKTKQQNKKSSSLTGVQKKKNDEWLLHYSLALQMIWQCIPLRNIVINEVECTIMFVSYSLRTSITDRSIAFPTTQYAGRIGRWDEHDSKKSYGREDLGRNHDNEGEKKKKKNLHIQYTPRTFILQPCSTLRQASTFYWRTCDVTTSFRYSSINL